MHNLLIANLGTNQSAYSKCGSFDARDLGEEYPSEVAEEEVARVGALAADLAACNVYQDARAAAAAVVAPTLFLLGTQDRMTPPKAAQSLIAAVKNATAKTLPGTGHMLMVERPDAVLDALAEIC
jgi:pimeloyl-ACP methyl ester carboxylesterase